MFTAKRIGRDFEIRNLEQPILSIILERNKRSEIIQMREEQKHIPEKNRN